MRMKVNKATFPLKNFLLECILLSLPRSEGPQPSLWTVTEVTVLQGFTRHLLALQRSFGLLAASRYCNPVFFLLSLTPPLRLLPHV